MRVIGKPKVSQWSPRLSDRVSVRAVVVGWQTIRWNETSRLSDCVLLFGFARPPNAWEGVHIVSRPYRAHARGAVLPGRPLSSSAVEQEIA